MSTFYDDGRPHDAHPPPDFRPPRRARFRNARLSVSPAKAALAIVCRSRAMAKQIKVEMEIWAKVIKESGMKPE